MENLFYINTKKSYDAGVEAFHQVQKDAHVVSIVNFAKTIPTAGFVVDLGCGTGRDSGVFMDSGHLYLGIDVSEKMIAKAKKSHPYARFEVHDIRALHFKDQTVDAFWGIDSLYHLTKKDFADFIAKACVWLKTGGQMFMVLKHGEGERLVKDLKHPTGSFFTSYYSQTEIEQLAQKFGFEIKENKAVGRSEIQGSVGTRIDSGQALVVWLVKKV